MPIEVARHSASVIDGSCVPLTAEVSFLSQYLLLLILSLFHSLRTPVSFHSVFVASLVATASVPMFLLAYACHSLCGISGLLHTVVYAGVIYVCGGYTQQIGQDLYLDQCIKLDLNCEEPTWYGMPLVRAVAMRVYLLSGRRPLR